MGILSKGTIVIALIACVLNFGQTASAQNLENSVENYLTNPNYGSEELASARVVLANYQVVFVSGFFGRNSVRYFEENIRAFVANFSGTDTRELTYNLKDVTDRKKWTLKPSSFFSTDTNAERLHKYLLETHRENQKPIILVAHSKGAAEAFYAMLAYPDLTKQNIVAKVILINAALGGSIVANSVDAPGTVGEPGRWYEKYIPNNLFYYFTQTIGGRIAYPRAPIWGGLVTMTRELARNIMSEVIHSASPELVEAAGQRIFYVRTESTVAETARIIRLFGWKAIADRLGANDGVVLVQDQCIAGIGQEIALIRHADHTALTTVSRVTSGSRERIEAFTKALFTDPRILFDTLATQPVSNASCLKL